MYGRSTLSSFIQPRYTSSHLIIRQRGSPGILHLVHRPTRSRQSASPPRALPYEPIPILVFYLFPKPRRLSLHDAPRPHPEGGRGSSNGDTLGSEVPILFLVLGSLGHRSGYRSVRLSSGALSRALRETYRERCCVHACIL